MLVSVTCVRDCLILGDIKIWGWYVLHHRVGSGLIFHGLVRIRSEKFNGCTIILIGEILGAYALTASLDRFPRFAYGLDHPKPWVWAFPTIMLDVGGMDTFDEMKIVSVNPHSYWGPFDGCRDTDHLRSSERVRWHGLVRCNQPKTIQLFALQYLRWCYDPNSSTSQSSQPYPQPCFQ